MGWAYTPLLWNKRQAIFSSLTAFSDGISFCHGNTIALMGGVMVTVVLFSSCCFLLAVHQLLVPYDLHALTVPDCSFALLLFLSGD